MQRQLHFPRSSRCLIVLSPVAILVLVGAFVVSARTWLVNAVLTTSLEPPPSVNNVIQPPGQAQNQSQTPTEQLEAELITVRPNGFEPAQINRPPGPFVLLIQNRSGTDLGPLRLESEEFDRAAPVSRIAGARIDKERQDYVERLELPPGRYRLRQSGKSGWSFGIAVTPR